MIQVYLYNLNDINHDKICHYINYKVILYSVVKFILYPMIRGVPNREDRVQCLPLKGSLSVGKITV